jgi:hypothetical protein
MAALITWTISQFDTAVSDEGLSDVVKTAHWQCNAKETVTVSGEEKEYSAGAYGSVGFGEPDPDAFVPYADITYSGGLEWVKATLGDEYCTSLESGLVANIEQQKNPPIVALPLPWISG